MTPFKENWFGDGRFRLLAKELNRMGAFLNNLRGVSGVTVTPNGKGGVNIGGRSDLPEVETLPWRVTVEKVDDAWKVYCSGGPVSVMLSGAVVPTGVTDLDEPEDPWDYVEGASVYVRYYHRSYDLTWSGVPVGDAVLTLAYGVLPENTYDAIYIEIAKTATVDGYKEVERRIWNSIEIEDAFRGQIRLWDEAEAVPDFWEIVTGMAGRFPVGAGLIEPGGNSYGLKATGGYNRHGISENDHGDHVNVTVDLQSGSYTIPTPQGGNDQHGDTDNRPPYYAVHFIRRK